MSVVDWLLDSDPSIRWQVMRDLTDEPDNVVVAERSHVARAGWGARMLALQGADGRWGGAVWNRGYDVLRGLDYLRSAEVKPDGRIAEAIELVEKNRGEDGRWPLQDPHAGQVHFDMDEGANRPSRWNTLRAMRVLKWAGQGE